MENNEYVEAVKSVQKIDMTEIEAERKIQEFFDQTDKLKTDHEFLRNCQNYQKLKNKN